MRPAIPGCAGVTRKNLMVDVVDARTRSRMMSGIRGRNTRPELALRRALHRMGVRYRLHVRSLPGNPDMVFPKSNAALFVHGCFWHQHPGCRYSTTPATRREFWQQKFKQNDDRDRKVKRELRERGWRVATVWECALKLEGEERVAAHVAGWLNSARPSLETPLSSDDFSQAPAP